MKKFFTKEGDRSTLTVKLSLIATIFSIFLLSYLPGGNVINKSINIAFALIVVLNAFFKRQKLHIGAVLILLYLWCIYGLLISIYAKDSNVSFNKILTMFQLAILLTCSASVVKWSKNIRLFMYIFIIAALMSYLTSLTFFSGMMAGGRVIGMEDVRAVGTLRDPNRFGIAMVHAQFMILYLLAISKDRREKILLLGGLIVFGIAVVQSGSRGALLGVVFTAMFSGWAFRIYNPNKHPSRLIVTLMMVMALVVISYIKLSKDPALMDRYLSTKRVIETADLEEEEGRSLRGRYALMQFAWKLALEHPFGVGFANFASYSKGSFSHSNIFEVLSCTGFPGLLLYYAIYLAIFLKAFKLPSQAFGVGEARRLVLVYPFILGALDIGLVNYYSKDLWLSISIISANLALAKTSNQSTTGDSVGQQIRFN